MIRFSVLAEFTQLNDGLAMLVHLFAGSDGGAERWAIVSTLLTTAKLNEVEHYAWLNDVLERMSGGHPMSQIDEVFGTHT